MQHISDEIAGWFVGTGGRGAGRTVLIISPFGKKLWDITVGRYSNGLFLGGQWPQFVAAHGIGIGWYLVFKQVRRGIFTLKVFDNNFVIKPFGVTITVLSQLKNACARKPQFIVPLQTSFKEKMLIPHEFLRRGYISEEDLNKRPLMATFLSHWHIGLERDGPDVFFAGSVWADFLDMLDLSETDVLLIKYQGCMNFSIEKFGHGDDEHIEEEPGCSEESKQSPGAQSQEEEHVSTRKRKQSNCKAPGAQGQEGKHVSTRTRKRKESNCKTPRAQGQEGERSKGERMLERHTTSRHVNMSCFFEIGKTGSQDWLKKEIGSDGVLKAFHLPDHFGYKKNCKILLRPMDRNESWEVKGSVIKRPNTVYTMNRFRGGWAKFCEENGLKKGDLCTFKVVNGKLWEVNIERR
ncbi:putative B3 domain-containing protein Os04g0347400 [Hordeum vulgare subsp. vulgare]|uniref:TF-B3 domain-containing protein n=1 Tax=Hordeum vulgare subsp. vulgare TaxID=112509 RepID=M0VHL2_HORVV|nr:putative B3 domain-containing protein Os04g0347400 [Hordeum vulgare subsp. vulgare]